MITNRYNIANDFSNVASQVVLNDFNFKELPQNEYDAVIIRIAKEKAVVHHNINASFDLLKKDGVLLLAGMKREGIKTYGKNASNLLGKKIQLLNGSKGAKCYSIQKTNLHISEYLHSDDYEQIRLLEIENLRFYSKPGIFGWKKIDRGSKLLISCISDLNSRKILDLGCGYGYLSILANKLGARGVLAVDNNAAAIAASEKNFIYHKIIGCVKYSDAGENIDEEFDTILCNPPYHHGFFRNKHINERFIANMSRLISANGFVYVVINSKMPYEKWAADYFENISILKIEQGFKVLKMESPK